MVAVRMQAPQPPALFVRGQSGKRSSVAVVMLCLPQGDRKCLGFSATSVSSGQGLGVVVSTGDNAEIGRISQMVSQVEQTKTNLLIQMEVLARWLAIIVVVISLGTFLLAWFRGGHGPGSAFQTAVAVAVAMIPAGLPALTTIVLAVRAVLCCAGHG